MKLLAAAALLAVSALPGVAHADQLICVEWWQDLSHPPIHLPECHGLGDCGFETVAQEDVTGGQDTFTGVAYGLAMSTDPATSISLSCEVRVNGGAVASTPPGPFGQVSFTTGQVTYVATDTDTVTLCAVWTGTETGENCGATITQQIPPEEVVQLIEYITAIPDFLLCPQLASLSPGVPGVVDIDSEGDVAIVGDGFWDCPPYGS